MELLNLIKSANTDHSRRVSQISGLMAQRAGFSQDESRIIAEAALFHDVGKAAIPQSILNKSCELTPDEFEIIKTHTTAGAARLREAAGMLSLAAVLAEQHHERIDGTGYHSLSAGEIHTHAKLVACADVFDALYSRRPYKEPWEMEKILRYFNGQANQFDPAMVKTLLNAIVDILALYQTK